MPPDPIQTLVALIVITVIAGALAIAAATFTPRLFRQPTGPWAVTLIAAGGTLGAGAATYLGCWWMEFLPRWRLGEVETRFLYVLVPAVLLIEIVAAFPKLPRWLAWALRLFLAVGAARLLLHGSAYLPDTSGAVTNEWTPAQTYLILSGLAAALLAVWALLALLMHRTGDGFAPLAVSATCAGAGVTVMLSGYLTGGELGLPLAAALAGAALAALVLPGRAQEAGVIGVGLIGLFGLVTLGRFFGSLSTLHAVLLFTAPLLCWLPELPGVRRLWPWARGILRIAVVLIPVAVVAGLAQRQATEESKSSPTSDEPTTQDYMNFQP